MPTQKYTERSFTTVIRCPRLFAKMPRLLISRFIILYATDHFVSCEICEETSCPQDASEIRYYLHEIISKLLLGCPPILQTLQSMLGFYRVLKNK